ncbi:MULTISPECIES: hypothetical protein [Heyndrickxia]|uniref:Uncharacterized protein n=1 Tax=Heyndrickxia sporothermodurans TaxID=46224 RepID=A0A150KL76_9BACI|nr:hypothetical protein B4102_4198 [Heyndrickxia sporothermodurans]
MKELLKYYNLQITAVGNIVAFNNIKRAEWIGAERNGLLFISKTTSFTKTTFI